MELRNALYDIGVNSHVMSEATPTEGISHSICSIADANFKRRVVACLGFDSKSFNHIDSENSVRYCGIGQNGLVLQPEGTVLTCPALAAFPVGNIHQQSLASIWCSSPELLEIRNKTLSDFPFCSICTESAKCGGGCRAKAYHYYGSLWYPDPISCIQHGVELRIKST